MNLELNSTSVKPNLPDMRFFAHPANSVPFLVTSALVTVCNVLLQCLRKFISENQYAVLSDHLEAFFLSVIMIYNTVMVIYGLALTAVDDPGHVFCACVSVSVRLGFALCLAVLIQSTVLRLLYLTHWRNVGAVNDEFFQLFFPASAALFALLYAANLTFFQGYMAFPTYQVCRNQQPIQRRKGDFSSTAGPDLIQLVMCLAAATSLALMGVLLCERKQMNSLHSNSRLPSGLPRVGDTHQSVYKYRSFLFFTLSWLVFLFLIQMSHWFSREGWIVVFPYSLAFTFSLLFNGLCSVVYVALRIRGSEPLKSFTKRYFREILDCFR